MGGLDFVLLAAGKRVNLGEERREGIFSSLGTSVLTAEAFQSGGGRGSLECPLGAKMCANSGGIPERRGKGRGLERERACRGTARGP